MLPIKYCRISQEYGRRNAKYSKGYHSGIDFVALTTDKDILSVGQGKVLRTHYDADGWGNYIIVRQDNGYDVLYAHLTAAKVMQGQKVLAGDIVGLQGSTGNTTGPHLHLEVWKGNWEDRNDINPADYLGIQNKVGSIKLAISQLQKAVETLAERGIISDSFYWLEHAQKGKEVSGENAQSLIIKAAAAIERMFIPYQ